jgi:hypothetical protein
MRRALPLLALLVTAAGVAACSGTPISTPVRSFDAPSDVALACEILDPRPDKFLFEARPLTECKPETSLDANHQHTDPCNPDPTTGTSTVYPPTTIGLVTNSARGELAQVNVQASLLSVQLADLNRRVPGFGFLPVGRMPRFVRASTDGCVALTSNADSCDLAVVQLPIMYNMPFAPLRDADLGVPVVAPRFDVPDFGTCNTGQARFIPPAGYADEVVRRIVPMVNGKKLNARPGEIELSPEPSGSIYGDDPDPAARPGQCTNGVHRAWVTLPGCQLVVEIVVDDTHVGGGALAPGEVVRALRITRTGVEVVTDLSTLQCEDECGAEPRPIEDAGQPTDGGTRLPSTQAFPGTLAIEPDPDGALTVRRMVIGDLYGERITIVPLEVPPVPRLGVIGAARTVTLEAGALGVSKVRVSPRSPAGVFVYAIARDSSVRVIDLDRSAECETNPDPRWLSAPLSLPPENGFSQGLNPPVLARRLGCFPLGDPLTPPRSALATSPGISIGGALPRDVAFVHVDAPFRDPANFALEPPRALPSLMVGDFAWILGSDGRMYAINVFDACAAPNESRNINFGQPDTWTPSCSPSNVRPSLAPNFNGVPVAFPGGPRPTQLDVQPHRARTGNDRYPTVVPACSDPVGAPRLSDESQEHPEQLTKLGIVQSATADGGVTFPTLDRQAMEAVNAGMPPTIQCAPTGQRSISFPSPLDARTETWTAAWEGGIPTTARSAGHFRDAGGGVVTLSDAGGQFCARGVLPGDKVVLTGCNTDDNCNSAQYCARDPQAPAEVTTGLCLDRGANAAFQLAACAPLLRGTRRFRIIEARQQSTDPASGDTTDYLRLGEIYEPEHVAELGPNVLCASDTDCSAVTITPATGDPATKLPTHCLPDVDGQSRCIRDCADGVCGAGYQCAQSMVPGAGPRCMRAPLTGFVQAGGRQTTLFAACVAELASYEVHVGDAFAVSGTATGFLVASTQDATGACARPAIGPSTTEWMRMRQSRLPIATRDWFGAVVMPTCGPIDFAGTLNPAFPLDPTATLAAHPLNQLKHDRVLALPNVCLYSDGTNSAARFENPFVVFALKLSTAPPDALENLAVAFIVTGGNFPLSTLLGRDVPAQQPRAALTAPDGMSIYVVDEGKQTTATGLRGQLLRFLSNIQQTDPTLVVR